jgi:hypothetical protein
MAWGQMSKEQLKELGVDPDKIAALETKLGNVVTKEELATATSSLTEIRDSIAALTQKVNTPVERVDNNNGGNNGGNNDQQRTTVVDPYAVDPVEFMENPGEHIKKMVQQQVAGVQLHSISLAAEMAYNTAKNSLPYFKVFEEEIKKEWDKYTPVQKGNPQVLIDNIYNLIKGRHLDEIITDTNKKEGKYNIVQSGGTSVIRPTTTEKKEELTDAELIAAKKFGMTPEEWNASKGGLKYVG